MDHCTESEIQNSCLGPELILRVLVVDPGITWLTGELLPGVVREHHSAYLKPGKRSQFKIGSTVSTQWGWFSHQRKAEKS